MRGVYDMAPPSLPLPLSPSFNHYYQKVRMRWDWLKGRRAFCQLVLVCYSHFVNIYLPP